MKLFNTLRRNNNKTCVDVDSVPSTVKFFKRTRHMEDIL